MLAQALMAFSCHGKLMHDFSPGLLPPNHREKFLDGSLTITISCCVGSMTP